MSAGTAQRYRAALLEDVIPFWERHSIDRECGGYLTCLDRKGKVYDTDKFTWLQARQVWTFATMFLKVERKTSWLEVARHGADFLARHGRDPEGNWHFSLDRSGRPLTQPYSLFSDCFAAMAFSKLFEIEGREGDRRIALEAWRNIQARRDDPKGRYSKAVPGARPLKPLSVPMILLNLAQEMAPVIGQAEKAREVRRSTLEILGFLEPGGRFFHEHIAPDGSNPDSFEGRLVNPGHGIEAAWFLLDAGALDAGRAADLVGRLLEFGWDPEHGGLFYFLDAKGKPPQQLEWDQKLWWVHAEALVALAMALRGTGRKDLAAWFEKVDDWTWKRFPDPKHGEWFGYLDRRGGVLLDLKGGKWKGCFHVPRMLLRCAEALEAT